MTAASPPPTCELAGTPVFIDGRVPCHCCGQTVKALLVDGLWVYAEHDAVHRQPVGGGAVTGDPPEEVARAYAEAMGVGYIRAVLDLRRLAECGLTVTLTTAAAR